MSWQTMTVKELRDELRARGLPMGGRKADLVARLTDNAPEVHTATLIESGGAAGKVIAGQVTAGQVTDDEGATAGASDVGTSEDETGELNAIFRRGVATVVGLPIPILVIAGLIVTSTLGYGAYTLVSQFFEEDIEYDLIDFNGTRARGFAQALVDMGNPGRLSGSPQEGAAADLVIDNLTALGFSVQDESYDVPMFEIMSEPELSICIPGGTIPIWSNIAPCGIGDVGQQVTTFEHRTDFVLQGYSGSGDLSYADNLEVVYLYNGSENSGWANATDKIALVLLEAVGVSSNTELYSRAAQNNVAALILWNGVHNCGKIEADDCVPIFKSIGVDDVKSAAGGGLPTDIPFMMVSNQTGMAIYDQVINGDGRLAVYTDVDNAGMRSVRTPCGTWFGQSEEMIVIGAHHDTVYNGPGAVDDTSGTASVLEMAHQFADEVAKRGEPRLTVRFCTWGGEEEGLWGSKAYVEAHNGELSQNLRLYVNLDMNHVDIDKSSERGKSVTLFGNNKGDVDAIKELAKQYQQKRSAVASQYEINFRLLEGEKGEENGLPYNSDHGPFAYDIDKPGNVLVCYGSGSWEYHTYADDMSRFNEESLGISVVIYGSYITHLAWETS
ncbi:MAG TPA: M20/M25/M40 family metallo-hydrolase [Candidatus Poseidoniales archaeon]|nr:M20/M25/M40 family metallo-hydrolase [Candidatus Poseidoniales archaeon]